jgi:hypothetical protein
MKRYKTYISVIHAHIVPVLLAVCIYFFTVPLCVDAATLKVHPSTGVYTVGKTFSISVLINTEGKSVNAADGQLTFNPRELQVVHVGRSGSIFNLWTEEPTFSNSAGTIVFGGGSPSGYTGSSGNVITITFKPLAGGNPKIQFKSGSILSADGMGTNILTHMASGAYTISTPIETPEPEYIAPPHTPREPVITSTTHLPDTWSREKTANLSWTLSSDIVSVRMLLDDAPHTIPTNVYDERITSKTLDDLDEGISYFHLQFKNNDGWGKVAHYTLLVDTHIPENFTVTQATSSNDSVGIPLVFSYNDISPVGTYKIILDGNNPISFTDEKNVKAYTLQLPEPGEHTVIVEAYDSAGNSSLARYIFTVEAFEKPIFKEYPERVNTGVIPAIKGQTRAHAQVTIDMRVVDTEEVVQSTVVSDEHGVFIFIPDTSLTQGVYSITAIAKDSVGKTSIRSDEIRFIVEDSGYITIGMFMVRVLSILIPLIALIFMLIIGTWYTWFRFRRWRKKIHKETSEIENSLAYEFNEIITHLHTNVESLTTARKGKLTKGEMALIEQIQNDLKHAREKIEKEISDVEDIIT